MTDIFIYVVTYNSLGLFDQIKKRLIKPVSFRSAKNIEPKLAYLRIQRPFSNISEESPQVIDGFHR